MSPDLVLPMHLLMTKRTDIPFLSPVQDSWATTLLSTYCAFLFVQNKGENTLSVQVIHYWFCQEKRDTLQVTLFRQQSWCSAFLALNCYFISLTRSISLWRRKWQPTPVFLPGESQGRGAWWAAIYGVSQSRTRLKRLSSSSSKHLSLCFLDSSHSGFRCWHPLLTFWREHLFYLFIIFVNTCGL